jgi:hypothetical protein
MACADVIGLEQFDDFDRADNAHVAIVTPTSPS